MAQEPPEESNIADLTDRPQPVFSWHTWLLTFVAAFALYAATANRGAQWQDSGSHILRAVTGELIHPLGLALTHPLHHALARLATLVPGLEPCLAITLISALAAAVAVANTRGCVWTLTRNRSASLFAAVSLGLAHTFWQKATITETYTLVAALLSAECWCIAVFARSNERRFLWGALLCNGLGIANHMLASLTLPLLAGVVVYALRTDKVRRKDAVVAVAMWLLGSLPYSVLVIGEALRTGDISATLNSALFGKSFAGEVLNLGFSLRMVLIGVAFVLLNFPNLLLPAAVYGMIRGRRASVPAYARLYLLLALFIHLWFVVRYNVVDQHTFFLPTYVLLSMFGGIGFAAFQHGRSAYARRVLPIVATATLVLTPVLYAFVPTIARRCDVLRSVERNKPYRDDYEYLFTPWSVAERSADVMSRRAVELAGRDGLIIVEDPMAVFAIRYRAIEAGRGGLEITLDAAPETIAQGVQAGRIIILVPKDVDNPTTAPVVGRWQRVGDLYQLSVESAQP